ncbi:MAG: OmpA family protein [Rhodobiaceae bacterium]|jgi:OOP family OmpA-OmpF porin|nr:OmpA family protein [Rhodobiaceae bacterium]
MTRYAAFLFCVAWAGQAAALDLALPAGSRLISDRDSAFDSYDLPVAPWDLGAVETVTLEGRVERQSWRVDSSAITTLQLLDPLRDQLAAAAFETVFECADAVCGGFDFRFAIEVIPAPDMYVDIRDFRFVAARRGDEALTLLVSRSRSAAYVQIIQVGPEEQTVLDVNPTGTVPRTQAGDIEDLSARLLEYGYVALSDLDFATGHADLNQESYDSLDELAAFLTANPGAVITLVGHTDAVGALEANIALSKRRAEAARDLLVAKHGLSGARIGAEGMGYLSPRASNLTQTGRERNRRVEAILLALE